MITGAKSAVDSSSDDSDDSSSDEDLDSESEHSDEEDYCFMVSTVESIQSYFICNASLLQSRAVRNSLPFFIWTCRRDDFLCRNLRKVNIVTLTALFTHYYCRTRLLTILIKLLL